MSHYTLQVVKARQTLTGRIKYRDLWWEHYYTYPAAWARGQLLDSWGYTWILHDWGTDPGPMPEPPKPGEDVEDEDWQARFATLNAQQDDVPF